jgi:hypothetical protein
LSLSKTKDVAQRGCRFCNAIIQSLDAFFESWRGARLRINIEMREKATIKVSLDGEHWKGEIIEIYAGSGRQNSTSPCQFHRPLATGKMFYASNC